MSARRPADVLAQALQKARPGDGAPPTAEARRAAITAIERAIAARKRLKRMRSAVMGAGLVAAAAAVVMVGRTQWGATPPAPSSAGALEKSRTEASANASANGGANGVVSPVAGANAGTPRSALVARPVGDAVNVLPGGDSAAIRPGDSIVRGSYVTTSPGARVVMTDATGTELVLAGDAEMSVVEDGATRAYALDRGALDLHVAKLGDAERLIVHTSDADVEVRGTRFRVEILEQPAQCGDGANRTRVLVQEGVVSVRRAGVQSRVAAGETWPSCAASRKAAADSSATSAGATSASATSASATSEGATSEGAMGASAGASGAAPPSTLEEQNDLFALGTEKKRRGDAAGAAEAFDRLLARYPNGPLAENAAAERMRALRLIDPAGAKAAANEYLTRWPQGFARDDARAVGTQAL